MKNNIHLSGTPKDQLLPLSAALECCYKLKQGHSNEGISYSQAPHWFTMGTQPITALTAILEIFARDLRRHFERQRGSYFTQGTVFSLLKHFTMDFTYTNGSKECHSRR